MLINLLIACALVLVLYLIYAKQSDPQYFIAKIVAKWLTSVVFIGAIFEIGIRQLHFQGILKMPNSPAFTAFIAIILILAIIASLLKNQLYQISTWWWQSWSLLSAIGLGLFIVVLCREIDAIPPDVTFIIMIIASVSAYWVTTWFILNHFAKDETKTMQLFASRLVEVADNFPAPDVAHQKWRDILALAFNPKTIKSISNNQFRQKYPLTFKQPTHIFDAGAGMAVLGFNGDVVLLAEASHGMRLFCDNDERKVDILWHIVSQTQAAQNAYLEGETHERKLVAEDLTEEIGKRLVSTSSSSLAALT